MKIKLTAKDFVYLLTIFVLMISLAYFFYELMSYKKIAMNLSKQAEYLEKHRKIVYKSEYYTKMSQLVWGKESRRCDAGLILKIEKLVQQIDSTLNVDDVLALITIESGFNNYAVSNAKALGLMQILYSTAKGIDTTIKEEDLFNEDINLRIGITYLSKLKKQFEGNLELALIAYNRGPGRLIAEMMNDDVKRKYSKSVSKIKGSF